MQGELVWSSDWASNCFGTVRRGVFRDLEEKHCLGEVGY